MQIKTVILLTALGVFLSSVTTSRSVQSNIRSDVIVTKYPQQQSLVKLDSAEQPGWMRRQLVKFGEVASKIGNSMGSHATKITTAIDKICEVIKTVIPLLAAVCHVGQFKFCVATNEAPVDLSQALQPAMLNLDDPDK